MQRLICGVSVLSALLYCSPALGDEAGDVIERAIKARAPKPELLDKQRCEVITMTGKVAITPEQDADANGEISAVWPNRLRWERNLTIKQKDKSTVSATVMAYDVDKAWKQSTGAPASDLDLQDTEEFKIEIYGRWLATLYPLRDKAFKLAVLKDSRTNGEEVSVVKASLRLRPDVYLYFSKKTGHLLKVSYQSRESGAAQRKEHVFSDYRDFDGLNLPTKMVDNLQVGNSPVMRAAEWTITGYKFVDKLGDDFFQKPEPKSKD